MNLFAITALFLLFNPAISISDTNHVHNVTVNFTSFVNGDSYLAMSDPVVGPGYSGSMGGWGTVSISFDPPSTIIECDGTIGYNVTLVMYGDLYDGTTTIVHRLYSYLPSGGPKELGFIAMCPPPSGYVGFHYILWIDAVCTDQYGHDNVWSSYRSPTFGFHCDP